MSKVLLRWLVMAAIFDWLVTRTITRSAIFMPKPPLILFAYQVLGWAGQLVLALTSLLALGALFGIAWSEWRNQRLLALPLLLLSQVIVSLLFLFTPPVGGLALVGHLLYLATVLFFMLWVLHPTRQSPAWRPEQTIAALLPMLALFVGRLHQALPAFYATWQWPGPPPLSAWFFNLGELLVVVSGLIFWWAYGRGATWPLRLAVASLALAFTGAHFSNAAMTGILAVWSMGLTLYLPWPLYALSFWCAMVTGIVTWQRGGQSVSWAILLLFASGYTPQLSVQALLSLIALWLLVTSDHETGTAPVAPSVLQPQTPFAALRQV